MKASAAGRQARDVRDVPDAFGRQLRRLALVWAGLIALLLASFGSAYLPLGALGWAPGIAIAAIKAALVARWFMRIDSAPPWSRIACLVAVCALALLSGLTWFEGHTRDDEPAAWQQPRQLPPARKDDAGLDVPHQ